jgi:two-component system, response regulator PdtaR
MNAKSRARDGVDAALVIHESVGSKIIFIRCSKQRKTVTRVRLDHPTVVLFKPIADSQLKAAVETTFRG